MKILKLTQKYIDFLNNREVQENLASIFNCILEPDYNFYKSIYFYLNLIIFICFIIRLSMSAILAKIAATYFLEESESLRSVRNDCLGTNTPCRITQSFSEASHGDCDPD